MTIKFGIIGASGIGYIHAQHFIQLGVNVVAILCSSELSAKNVSKKLALTFNIKVSPYYNLKDFLNEELDDVSICSPPNLHFYHIEACFNKNIKVFCEKPLFWNDSITKIDLMEKISFLESHKNRSLFVNTSNTVFLDAISKTESKKAVCYCFSFEFFTNGKNEGISIAEDLLPHGISLLIHKMGKRTITKYTCSILKNAFKCSFYYGE